MLYKFKSKAGADVIMTGPHGDALLKQAGREPAAQGIFTPEQMPQAIASIEAAIAADEAARRAADEGEQATPEAEEKAPRAGDRVSLRARAWPLLELLRRAQAAGHPVTWGA
ncbi:DUF1840 domain-containing protein [Rivibacter subsaxonicus]|uniref:Uncharacterized protein DUF1840 n=1 Tax=Rivibacter subsaxonicus TaxID=457575 RepID=A0A4Q7VVS5_9BURK|nr:DUF1840 domain-containing protein [Rivibacter subsaxonicus]RZU00528.1 uncharacterized protein DUF1840 [Rivibacter subsaxonicus]